MLPSRGGPPAGWPGPAGRVYRSRTLYAVPRNAHVSASSSPNPTRNRDPVQRSRHGQLAVRLLLADQRRDNQGRQDAGGHDAHRSGSPGEAASPHGWHRQRAQPGHRCDRTLEVMSTELSVVVPMYNEQEVLPLLVARLRPALDQLDTAYEVLVRRRRQPGPHPSAAPAAVPRVASGARGAAACQRRAPGCDLRRLGPSAGDDCVVPSTPTCRTRPRSSPTCSPRPREQVDVVYGVRGDRSSDSVFKRVSARAFYAGIRAISGTRAQACRRLPAHVPCDGRAVNQLPQANRVLRLVVPALHFPSATVDYEPRSGPPVRPSTRSSRCCGSRWTR